MADIRIQATGGTFALHVQQPAAIMITMAKLKMFGEVCKAFEELPQPEDIFFICPELGLTVYVRGKQYRIVPIPPAATHSILKALLANKVES